MFNLFKNKTIESKENSYSIYPDAKEYTSRLRAVNKKYNTLVATIPKAVIHKLDLNEGDLLSFKIISEDSTSIVLDIRFIKGEE